MSIYGPFGSIDAVLGEIDPTRLDCLEAIPSLVDKSGTPNKEFLAFKESVSKAVLLQDWNELWKISDRAQTPAEFYESVKTMWGNYFEEFNQFQKERKNLSVDLNVERFKATHKAILGSFWIATYALSDGGDSIQSSGLQLTKAATELYFTFKQGKFCVVSAFTPFSKVRD